MLWAPAIVVKAVPCLLRLGTFRVRARLLQAVASKSQVVKAVLVETWICPVAMACWAPAGLSVCRAAIVPLVQAVTPSLPLALPVARKRRAARLVLLQDLAPSEAICA